MKTLYIHFGMHKTGSSSIQESFFNKLSADVTYIDFGRANSSGSLIAGFSAAPEKNHAFRKRKVSIEELLQRGFAVRKRLEDVLSQTGGGTYLLSAESLMTLSESELLSLYKFVAPHVDTVICVGYVRPPKGYMESSFQEVAKFGSIHRLVIESFYPGYRNSFEKFDNVFGAENVWLWAFEPKHFPENCVVRDFCKKLEISYDPSRIVRINEGISRKAMSLLYIYNKFGPSFVPGRTAMQERRLLVNKLSELSGEKVKFAASAVSRVITKNREDVDWIEKRLNRSLAEEMGSDRGAIGTEDDLLAVDMETIEWLARQVGRADDAWCETTVSATEIADLVHLLRQQLVSRFRERGTRGAQLSSVRVLTSEKLVEDVAKEFSGALGQISVSELPSLVSGVLQMLSTKLEATHDGMLEVNGLGKFHIRVLDAENEGLVTKRIVFAPTGGACTDAGTAEGGLRGGCSEAGRIRLEGLGCEMHSNAASGKDCRYRATSLRPKALSDFALARDPRSLVSSNADAIYFAHTTNRTAAAKQVYLNDCQTNAPYVLNLHGAKLIPANYTQGVLGEGRQSLLPAGLRFHRAANLLLTGDDRIISDSIHRYGFVPEGMSYTPEGTWDAILPDVYLDVTTPCMFIDLVSGHFGHALVDTPARLWPLFDELGAQLKEVRFVGFGTHRVNQNAGLWPLWLKKLLYAYGIDPLERLLIVDVPMRFSSLLVPKRISPHQTESGPEYDRVMSIAGDRLLGTKAIERENRYKIFLSRSRLDGDKRSLDKTQEMHLDEIFKGLGYSVLHPQEMSLEEQVSAVRGATHIAGCVGSQMHLTAFCNRPAPRVLRIAPSFFARGTDSNIAIGKGGVVTDYLVACETPGEQKPALANWCMSASELELLPEFVRKWEQ